MTHRPLLAAVLTLSTLAVACGDQTTSVATDPAVTTTSAPTSSTVPEPTPLEPTDEHPAEPPAVTFASVDGAIDRRPFTTCWSAPPDDDGETVSFCADGVPEDPSPVPTPIDGSIEFTFPLVGWDFTAAYADSGTTLPVRSLDATTWSLGVPDEHPAGALVIVSGFGPQGDVHVSISLPGDADPSTFTVEVWDRCAAGISVGVGDDLYLLVEGAEGLVDVGRPWEPADFPRDWDVDIYNASPADGDDFAIRGLEASFVDDVTLSVVHPGSGAFVGTFVLDTTPVDERFLCG